MLQKCEMSLNSVLFEHEIKMWYGWWLERLVTWRKLWWLMEILFCRRFGCCCYLILLSLLLLLLVTLFILHEHERKHSDETSNCDAEYASLGKSENLTIRESIIFIVSLTKFDARRADLVSSWTGVRSGARTPITSTRRSTYTALPIPSTSEMVLPSAAAAIVEIVMMRPKLCSM